ncbi:DUF4003 family protein [Saccharibacillus qingshengii]|uniref:DUF4003 family protein n=1 Tax=Saccharibacillus qingshengii TaxID=1763540 RepID=UPI001556FD66|nr:DUF4003 family protein [Saccharibacillus qingshengii]
MNPIDQNRLQLLVSNMHAIKKEFAWQSANISRLAAMLYAAEEKEADPAAIRACQEQIKQSTGVFSMFRGNLALGIAAMLSLENDPQALLNETLDVYEEMKSHKFTASDYLVVAAYEIARNTEPSRRTETIGRAKTFYDGMKENHPFLTSHDDYIFAAMLGLSTLEPGPALKRMEQFYTELKPEFHASNRLQALTQVLVLGDAGLDTTRRLAELQEGLRGRKLRMDKEYLLPSLGLLALLPAETGTIVDEIEEACTYLRDQKGFGSWSVLQQELLLLASGVVISRSVGEAQRNLTAPAISAALTNLVIAQQATMLASTAAIAAINTSASSS